MDGRSLRCAHRHARADPPRRARRAHPGRRRGRHHGWRRHRCRACARCAGGTARLPCPESGASQVHKDALLATEEDDTRITEKFSGKPARGLVNRFIREMADAPQLAFPAQNSITSKLRVASAKAGKPDCVALWAGQAAALSRQLPAAELIRTLEQKTIAALRAGAALVKE